MLFWECQLNRKAPLMQILTYNGQEINQRDHDGYINATQMCQANGKLFADWKRSEDYKRYTEGLSLSMGIPIDRIVISKPGRPSRGGGTWIHPKLAIKLARWISVEFELWCDDHIQTLIETGKTEIPKTKLYRDAPWYDARLQGKGCRLKFTDAIKAYHDYMGTPKKRRGLDYALATNVLYGGLYGRTAKQLRQDLGLGKRKLTRDFLTTREIRIIDILESIAIGFMLSGMTPVDAASKAMEQQAFRIGEFKDYHKGGVDVVDILKSPSPAPVMEPLSDHQLTLWDW